jgi:sec-independent protein translocase protein TatB
LFGLSLGETLILAAIGLIVIGPKELPRVARVIGRFLHQLRVASKDVTAHFSDEVVKDIKKDLRPDQQFTESLKKAVSIADSISTKETTPVSTPPSDKKPEGSSS